MSDLKNKIKKLLFSLNLYEPDFVVSEKYWEKRYLNNSNSGSGSYGRLAEFKAHILNNFVKENNIQSVIELGCGDGNQLRLANYQSYIGYDVSETAIELCKSIFEKDVNKSFYLTEDLMDYPKSSDLVLSLDVIFHLTENEVYNSYMQQLFRMSNNYVIIYSSNYHGYISKHVRCRKFTKWIDNNVSDEWEQITYIKNRYPFESSNPSQTSMADFYIYKKK
ncbi:class I SAM-dependent methyltransferase [Psychroserpens burtonensis]|uniref:class I SAM-dependent methyltransferase n=1 Tax=Psychroserpens burtonensis TaxID=49278 RepID=UPI000404F17C|nr:class I SAM-dependent methyltransferase [Psychroserpens burtonensis]